MSVECIYETFLLNERTKEKDGTHIEYIRGSDGAYTTNKNNDQKCSHSELKLVL
jgi:hypothetical protein